MSLLDAVTVSVQPVAEATTDPGVEELVLMPTRRTDPLDGLQVVNTGTVSVNTSGFTLKVAVPVLLDPVTMNVSLLPATAGVTLTPVNWPDENDAEVPVIPAVPLYVTVVVKLVTVLLPASCAVSVIPVMGVPTVCGEEMAEITKWSNPPILIVTLLLVPVLLPVAEVAVKVPEPVVPVYFRLRLARLAMPELKSLALVSLFVPDNPDIAPDSVVLIVTLFVEALNVEMVLL